MCGYIYGEKERFPTCSCHSGSTEEFITKNPDWVKELELMVSKREKAEIQALSSFGFHYLSEVYLPTKLKNGDWI